MIIKPTQTDPTDRRWLWTPTPSDPVERTMRELARQGTTMARVAHLFATLMVILFSLGSFVALSGDAFSAVMETLQHGGVPSIPAVISIAVSTLMVVCCDIGLVYAAMTLRVLRIRGAEEGRLLHLTVLIGVSAIEASTYFYMSLLYEHPTGWGLFLVIARALTAPLLSVYLSMARAHPVTPRDILHQAELAQGIQLVRDVVQVAQDPRASLADKMRLYEASAEMSASDKTRLQGMIKVVQERLIAAGGSAAAGDDQEESSRTLIPTAVVAVSPVLAEADAREEPIDGEEHLDEIEEAPLPMGRYNARRITERIEATR
jgi:hypothetical protein